MELIEVLEGIQYPANKVQIIIHADKGGVSHGDLNLLSSIPNKTFYNIHEVKSAITLAKYADSI